MSRHYSEDLAYIHHEGFSTSIRQATPYLLRLLNKARRNASYSKGEKPLVVDLGCGSGVWARELVQAGYDVVAVDISDAMIRLARKNVSGARFVQGSFLDTEFPQCDAVTALGEVVNYAFDARVKGPELLRFFRRVYAALRPGGVFVLDVAGPGRAGPRGRREGGSVGPDWAIFFRVDEDRSNQKLTRTITSFRSAGKLYRRTNEIHEQRLYRPVAITRHLQKAGFRVERMPEYGRSGFPPGLAGFVATKARSG
jgi:SAM-dependent methyltransferase